MYFVSLLADSETVVRCEPGKIRIMACSKSCQTRGYIMSNSGIYNVKFGNI